MTQHKHSIILVGSFFLLMARHLFPCDASKFNQSLFTNKIHINIAQGLALSFKTRQKVFLLIYSQLTYPKCYFGYDYVGFTFPGIFQPTVIDQLIFHFIVHFAFQVLIHFNYEYICSISMLTSVRKVCVLLYNSNFPWKLAPNI